MTRLQRQLHSSRCRCYLAADRTGKPALLRRCSPSEAFAPRRMKNGGCYAKRHFHRPLPCRVTRDAVINERSRHQPTSAQLPCATERHISAAGDIARKRLRPRQFRHFNLCQSKQPPRYTKASQRKIRARQRRKLPLAPPVNSATHSLD